MGFNNALIRAQHIDLFGSSDEAYPPPPIWSRSVEYERGVGSVNREDNDGDALIRQSPDDRGDYGVERSVNTRRQAADRNILGHAPEKTSWLLSHRVLARLSDTTSEHHRIRLFYSSQPYKLDPSASNYRTEHDFFIEAFFKH